MMEAFPGDLGGSVEAEIKLDDEDHVGSDANLSAAPPPAAASNGVISGVDMEGDSHTSGEDPGHKEAEDSDASQEQTGTDSSQDDEDEGSGEISAAILGLEAGPDSASCPKDLPTGKKKKDIGDKLKRGSSLKGPFEGLDAFRLCRICGDTFKNPQLLSCLHTYCTACMQTLIQLQDEKTLLKCPACHMETMYEETPQLPVHHLSKRLAEGRMLAGAMQKCSICALHELFLPAVKICFECKDFFCEGCADKHKFSRFTIDHKITDLDEDSLQESLDKVHIDKIMCMEHEKEEMRFYCEDCYDLICRDCVILKHSDHKVLPVNQAVSARKKEFEFRLLGMKERQKLADKELSVNEEVMSHLQKVQEKEISKVKAEIAELKQRLDKEEELAIASITKKMTNTLKSGKRRKKCSQVLLSRISEVSAHSLKFLQQSSEEEFLANQSLFLGAMTMTLNTCIAPDPLNWIKPPSIQTSTTFKLAKTEPLFVVQDKRYVYSAIEDMSIQCSYAQMLAKKMEVTQGLDYVASVQNKIKSRQKAETKHAKKEEAKDLTEALGKLATKPKVPPSNAAKYSPLAKPIKSKLGEFQVNEGGDNYVSPEQAAKKAKKQKNRRKKNFQSANSAALDSSEKPNTEQQEPMQNSVTDQVKKKQQIATNNFPRIFRQKTNQPSTFTFKFNTMADGATGGPPRVPTLAPLWRIDVYLRTDKFQPNITASLCIGLEKIAVADSINNKIKLFATSGEFLEEHTAIQPVSLAYCAGKLIWCSENKFGFLDLGNKDREEVTFDLDVVPHPLSTGSITQLFIGNGQNVCEYNWTKKDRYWAQTSKILPKHSNKKRFKSNIMSLTNSSGGQTIVYSDWQQGCVVFMDRDGTISSVYREAEKQNGFLPTGLFYDRTANTVFVLDHQGNRLLLLSHDGKLVQEWSTLPAIQKPLSVVGNRSGQLFLTGNDQFLHVYQFTY